MTEGSLTCILEVAVSLSVKLRLFCQSSAWSAMAVSHLATGYRMISDNSLMFSKTVLWHLLPVRSDEEDQFTANPEGEPHNWNIPLDWIGFQGRNFPCLA